MKNPHVGFEIRTLSNLIRWKINRMIAEEEETLTANQIWVLDFLVRCGDREVVQRDIEKEFSIRRSTASHMLTLMENNGYIARVLVPQDARMKRIVLTEKGCEAQRRMTERLERFEGMLRDGITDEDLDHFREILKHFEKNIQ